MVEKGISCIYKLTLAQVPRCHLAILISTSPLQQRSSKACLATMALLGASAAISVVAIHHNLQILFEDRYSRTAARTRSKDFSSGDLLVVWFCGLEKSRHPLELSDCSLSPSCHLGPKDSNSHQASVRTPCSRKSQPPWIGAPQRRLSELPLQTLLLL